MSYSYEQVKNLLNFSVAFMPTSAFPLDPRSMFGSYDDALNAAKSAKPAGSSESIYYYGQTLTVIEDDKVTDYKIQTDNTLKEIGRITMGDNKSISLGNDGKLSLKSFGEEYYAYIAPDIVIDGEFSTVDDLPETANEGEYALVGDIYYIFTVSTGWIKTEDGFTVRTEAEYRLTSGWKAGLEPRTILDGEGNFVIAWYEPSSTTVEGLVSIVSTVRSGLDNANTALTNEIARSKQAESDLGKRIDTISLTPGPKGDKGDPGETGPKGDTGDTGPKGDPGETGPKGDKGDTGETGPKGDKGDPGETGPKGDTGETGPKGDKGDTGKTAFEYAKDGGYSGNESEFAEKLANDEVYYGDDAEMPEGNNVQFYYDPDDESKFGESGESAYQIALKYGFEGTEEEWIASLKGETGETGPEGPQGLQGEKGDTGETGPKGDKGDTGETGPKGDPGDTGETGPKGDKGDPGETGPKGDTGETGPKGDTGETGPKGDTGETGPKGDTGLSAYEIAKDRGFEGTEDEWLESLIGPKGDKGDTGETGPKGDTGETGPKGDPGETGPKGDTGETGPKGDTGETGPKGDKGDKGDPGETGPKGDKGDKGDPGETGPKGDTGETGPVGPAYTLTNTDKETIVNAVKQSLSTEVWTFVLDDDSNTEVQKTIYVQ